MKSIWLRGVFAAAAVCFILMISCSPARRGEVVERPVEIASAEAQAGQLVFMYRCQECHPGGAAGLGPALNNKPLPGFLIRWPVRRGFGAMPAFSSQTISDEQLDALVTYVKILRRAD